MLYQEELDPVLGEILPYTCELGKVHDIFAVKVTKAGITIKLVPKKISLTCLLQILTGGTQGICHRAALKYPGY